MWLYIDLSGEAPQAAASVLLALARPPKYLGEVLQLLEDE
jgi:hypothetical protein